ncbi:MAG: sigma-54-dependent Fis family transcriptional regulator [Planctomycetaceae bacterium]
MAVNWMTWSESPWLARDFPHSTLVQLCDRLDAITTSALTSIELLDRSLPQIAVELNGDWACVVKRSPQWVVVASSNANSAADLPKQALAESLDRGAAGSLTSEGNDDRPAIVVPLIDRPGQLLLVWGRHLQPRSLGAAWALARVLSRAIVIVEQRQKDQQQLKRLRSTLALGREFASEKETMPLLERIADKATELLDCDRASIFLWDREQRQLVACPALGVEGGRLWVPDNKGIVGEVVQTGRTIRVDDAYADDRFDKSVDKESGYRTRSLLCAPLIDGDEQRIGAFELINKHGGAFDESDEQALIDMGLQVATVVQSVREREQLIRNNQQLTEAAAGRVQIIGESPPIAGLRASIGRLAATDLPVLILGESGTGKEVAAQALHYQGPRADHPFVAVNCAALTETLLESELFGHEKGAFTDAHDTRAGKFELANGGTLFLDEIGDMSPGGQAKLLRVLEQKVITRVGGSQVIPINVRVVAATNRNLVDAVRSKKFREDLYYRLSVVTLDLPPLRERPEDVQPLAEHFLAHFSKQANRRQMSVSSEARRRLQAHAWPGNVRELRNLMERVAFLSNSDVVETDDLAFILSPDSDSVDYLDADVGLSEATNRFQQEYIRKAIKRVKGNMSEAARLMGLHRSNLYRKMRQLDMEVDDED